MHRLHQHAQMSTYSVRHIEELTATRSRPHPSIPRGILTPYVASTIQASCVDQAHYYFELTLGGKVRINEKCDG
jgi:hypothetical protein